MRGRRVLMESLVSHGVRHIFGNPGTTETPLLDSLPAYPQLDYVMTLHEGVAVGAASFYAQAARRPAVANLHVAPGLGNAIGSLYGALKAGSPVLVTAGQQDTRMRLTNPLLGHDLVAMAAPVTKWSVQIERADEIAPILRRAFKVATDAPQGPVFVALPISDRPFELPPIASRRCGPDPQCARRERPRPAPGRAVLRGYLACRGRPFPRRHGRRADRGGAGAPGVQSPPRCRRHRRHGGEPRCADEFRARAGDGGIPAGRRAAQPRACRTVGAGEGRLPRAAGEGLEP
ncbi:MAG: hypothetical protein KGM94_14250 [Bradyrhizobium sp.]|nr:hypothetical protein [Bradyrhizobium sp.]